MTEWEPAKLREGFDHRGHQCNACGMHHCHIQVIRQGPARGRAGGRAGVRGLVGRGLADRPHRQGRHHLAQYADRPRLRGRQRVRLGVRLGDGVHGEGLPHREAGRLPPQVGRRGGRLSAAPDDRHREGFGDILAEGVKRASEKVGGEAAKCAIYTKKGAAPRGHDHRGRWDEMLDTCTSSNGTMESANPTFPTEIGLPGAHQPLRRRAGGAADRRHPRPAPLRGLAGRLLLHLPDADRDSWPARSPPRRAGTTR